MTITCDICGATTDIEGVFIKTRRFFLGNRTTYCPFCWPKHHLLSLKSYLWIWVVFALVGIIAVFIKPVSSFGWFLLNIFLIGLISELMIVPHELGHAFMSNLLGMRVFKIIIGTGSPLSIFRLFGILWEIKQIPIGGLTLTFSKSARFYRIRRFLVVSSGPIVNLAFLLLALNIQRELIVDDSLGIHLYPVICFLLANFLLLAINLIPHRFATTYGKIPNDGLSLLLTPFLSRKKVQQEISLYYVIRGLEYRNQRQFEEAKQCFQKGLDTYPDDITLSNVLGLVLLDLRCFQGARDIFLSLLQKGGYDVNQKAIYLNNLAYTDILIGEQNLLEEADKCSGQAYQSCSWVSAIQGTRGMVLIELGNLDEGISLLKKAIEANEEPKDKAINVAYTAIGEKRKGNKEMAQKYLETASCLDSDCMLLQRAYDELQKE